MVQVVDNLVRDALEYMCAAPRRSVGVSKMTTFRGSRYCIRNGCKARQKLASESLMRVTSGSPAICILEMRELKHESADDDRDYQKGHNFSGKKTRMSHWAK